MQTFDDLIYCWKRSQPEYFQAETNNYTECDWFNKICSILEGIGMNWSISYSFNYGYKSVITKDYIVYTSYGKTKTESLLKAYLESINVMGLEISGVMF